MIIRNVAFFLFVFLLPTQFGRHFFYSFSYLSGIRSDYLAPTLYVTDLLVVLLIFLHRRRIFVFFKDRFVVLVLLILGINVAIHRFDLISMYRFVKLIELLGVYGIFTNLFSYSGKRSASRILSSKNTRSWTSQDDGILRIILWGFLIGGIFQAILTIWQFVIKHSVGGIFYFLGERYVTLSLPDIGKTSIDGVEFLRGYGTFSHPNSLGGFYLLLYALFLFHKNIKGFWLKNLMLLMASILIFLSFSKVAITGFMLINALYMMATIVRATSRTSRRTSFARRILFELVENPTVISNEVRNLSKMRETHIRGRSLDKLEMTEEKDYVCKLCLVARFVVGIGVALIIFAAHGDPLTLTKRLTLTDNALYLIKTHLLFGVGLGNYVRTQHYLISSVFLQPVHNILLLFVAETGIIVGGVVLYFLGRFVYVHRRNLSLVSCILVIIFTGLFDHYWWTLQQNWLLMPVVFALIIEHRK